MQIEGRRLPVGAELVRLGDEPGTHFRVWAPDWREVTLVIEGERERTVAMQRGEHGYASAFVPEVGAGTLYRYRLGDTLHADPASRYQPEGPFGPSQVIDPNDFSWTDRGWRGVDPAKQVIYELHVGTFTPTGTYEAAARALPFLADLGVTTIELMPIADFAGRHGWGYDGVNPFAPTRLYGEPRALRQFIDEAHAHGLAVILDVVYNHFGPAGNSFFTFAKDYRASRPGNEWGDNLNFDGPTSGPVRELFIANAGYWIDEFHFDGLRLDATQAIYDSSREHILAAITRRARAAAGARTIFIAGENEPQDVRQLRPIDRGGFGFDALWNDDFHHSARVAATGIADGYLSDYRGTPQELVSATKRGFLYQGQMYPWQRNPRGTAVRDLRPQRFVHFLTNHDQEANSALGQRLTTIASPRRLRALTALLLLSPSVPLLFQGQETGTTRPWYFFADHDESINQAVRDGRAQFMTQFSRFADPSMRTHFPDPASAATFAACVLDPAERNLDRPWVKLHRDLLRRRRDDPAFTTASLDGAVLDAQCFALRWCPAEDEEGAGDRLLLVNLGASLHLSACAEPLVAPPPFGSWTLAWSSEDPSYGGQGQPPPYTRAGLRLGAETAVLLVPEKGASLRLDPAPLPRQERWSFEP